MARIAGIDLPREKMAQYALPVLYGIGKHNVLELLEKAKIDPRKKIKDLDENEVQRLRWKFAASEASATHGVSPQEASEHEATPELGRVRRRLLQERRRRRSNFDCPSS